MMSICKIGVFFHLTQAFWIFSNPYFFPNSIFFDSNNNLIGYYQPWERVQNIWYYSGFIAAVIVLFILKNTVGSFLGALCCSSSKVQQVTDRKNFNQGFSFIQLKTNSL